MVEVTRAWCPGCRAELSEAHLRLPIMACSRCGRIITWPEFHPPPPQEFKRFDEAARRASARLHRKWTNADDKGRVEIKKKLKALVQLLETM